MCIHYDQPDGLRRGPNDTVAAGLSRRRLLAQCLTGAGRGNSSLAADLMLRLEGTAVKSPFAIAPATGLGAFALVGIGCSAGCVPILKELASYFDKRWRAAFVVTTHIGAHESYLPELLQKDCSLHVAHAEDFDLLEPHRVYIAPPDRHLIVRRAHLRLDNGPRQNWTRPAIDPM